MFLIRLCCDHATQLNIYCQQQQQQVTLVGQGVVVSVTERKNWESDDSTLQAVYKPRV